MNFTLNQELFLSINSLANHNIFLDTVMIFIAKNIPYIFIGLLFYLWFSNRKNEALYSGYATTLAIAINQTINLFYFHSRPFMDNIGIALLEHKAENSFPSDHTTFILAIALILLKFQSTRTLGIITTFFAFLGGVARVYCGVHYPFDILGSLFTAVLSIIIILILKNQLNIINKFILYLWNTITKTIFKN